MDFQGRLERRRVRWFFAGLLVIGAVIDIVGAILVQHQTRSQILEALVPASVTLGGRTGAVLSGLALLLLAGGIARGKRIASRLTVGVLIATVAFELIKDLDFEAAALFAWILFGLLWFRHHFDADSDPLRVRWGLAVLGLGVAFAVLYAFAGAALLQNQLEPEFGSVKALESLLAALSGSPTAYRALTARAAWFLETLPVVSYTLVILGLLQLLRPVLAPRISAGERERLHDVLKSWGRNYISHLAVHGASSYLWLDDEDCVAYTLWGRTALALGDPIGRPVAVLRNIREFVAYCDRQDWIPAFYQVDDVNAYRELGLTLVPIGVLAVLKPANFGLEGRARSYLRSSLRQCERQGIRFVFGPGPDLMVKYAQQLEDVSMQWLHSHRSPELRFSLGTLTTLADPDVGVGLAIGADGRLEGFISWLPVPLRHAWALDLMRRRPDGPHGVMEALLVSWIREARREGIAEVSLGMTPRKIASHGGSAVEAAWRAMYWGLDRFERSSSLHRFKEKFGPTWEDRYLVVPSPSTLPEVLVAIVRAHLPSLPAMATWVRSRLSRAEPAGGRRALA